MTQVPILSGIVAEFGPGLERSLPVNLFPIAEPGDGSGTGISRGYLALASGAVRTAEATGASRGAALFGSVQVRVFGDGFYTVTEGKPTRVGTVATNGLPASFAEGFGRIGIASGNKLYYWDGTGLMAVTDEDLGNALSVTWLDSYFVTTDGTSLVATDLADPTSINPLRYGSSEADPDPVLAVHALRGELYALNRYSIEKFVNAGAQGNGNVWPFQRSRGSQIPKGVVGSHAWADFAETFAFCGSARNEAPRIYLAGAGQAIGISPRTVDDALGRLTDVQLGAVELETVNVSGQLRLYVHLPDRTYVYHYAASNLLDVPVWSVLRGGSAGDQGYALRHFLLSGGEWWAGAANALARVDDTRADVLGEAISYRFDTPLLYNEGRVAFVPMLELVPLGSGAGPVALSWTDDEVTWSQPRFCGTGARGRRDARPAWLRLGRIRSWRGYRFEGRATAPVGFARLDATLEAGA